MNLKYLYASKVSIVPTWRLWLSLLVVAIAMFASINFQTSALHWFVYTVLFVFSASVVFTLAALSEIKNDWYFKKTIFADDSPDISLKIEGANPYGVVMQNKNVFDTSIGLPVGKTTIAKLSLYTEYPLGYFKANIPLTDIGPIWVYPKPVNHSDKSVGVERIETGDMFKTYQPGDSPKKILKKTLSLPSAMWKSKKEEATSNHKNKNFELDWKLLDQDLTDKQKIEQLSYLVNSMPENQQFSMKLNTKKLNAGSGGMHKHAAWRLLAEEWITLGL